MSPSVPPSSRSQHARVDRELVNVTTERAHPSVLAAKIAPISDERTPPANTSTSFVAPPGRAASLDAQWPVLARSSDRRIRRFDLPVGRGLGCKSGARWRRPAAALSGLPCTQVIAPGTSTTSVPVPNTAFNPERLSATGHGAWPPGASSPGGFVRAQAGSAEPEHTRDRRFGAALSCRSDQETSSLWGVSASWSYGRDVLCDNIWREARVSEARGGREPSICTFALVGEQLSCRTHNAALCSYDGPARPRA